MVDQRLTDYINDSRSKNISNDEITKSLQEHGWPTETIQEALNLGKISSNALPNNQINSPVVSENSSTKNNVKSHSLNIILFVIGLVILFILSTLIFLIYNSSQKKKQNTVMSPSVVTVTPTIVTNNFQDLANTFFIASKQRNVDNAYGLFSMPLQQQISKDKLTSLFNELDLTDSINQIQNSLDDITLTIGSTSYQGKKYLGIIYYNSPPNGNLEIRFIQEANQWKIVSFNFNRQTIANSGNLDTDLSKIKKNVNFDIFKPTYLPSNYAYDGTTILASSNQNIPDGKAHPIISFSFSDKTNKTLSGSSKQILMIQVNYPIDESSLLTYVKKQLTLPQTASEVPIQGGTAIYVSGGLINVFTLIKGNSIISLTPDPTITKADLIKIANSLQNIL